MDITYLDLLNLDSPVEEFRLIVTPPAVPDFDADVPEVTPLFNHRNHLNALLSTGRSTWLGLALHVPEVTAMSPEHLSSVFSALVARHDALRWAVFPDLSSLSTPTPNYSVHSIPPERLTIQEVPAAQPQDISSYISEQCSPLNAPGVFFARCGEHILACFDHFHVDMISIDILARELREELKGLASGEEKETVPTYAEAIAQRAEIEETAWDEALADEVWGEFFRETDGTIPAFPVDLGAEGETHPPQVMVEQLVSDEQLREDIAAKPFPHILTAIARVLGQRTPLLIPMHTRGKNGAPMHSTVGWLVGNAPVIADPKEPATATQWLRNAVKAQGLSIEQVLGHYQPAFASATIFSASFVDFTKRGGSVPGASYVSAKGSVDSVQMWFSRTETGLQLRVCYPDTAKAREFMPRFVAQLKVELS